MASEHENSTAKAVSYLRVSGRGQIGGDGFPRQREAVKRYADSHNLDIVAEYRDEGVRGEKELADRKGLAALMDHIQANGVRIVLVEQANRIARDLMVGEIILADLRKRGVRVLSADGGIDTQQEQNPNDPDAATRTLIRQLLGAVAQYDKALTVWKLRAARQRIRRQHGRCEGRRPYGCTSQERAILTRMQQLASGRTAYGVAQALNAEGLPSRSGKPWAATSVKRIVGRVKA